MDGSSILPDFDNRFAAEIRLPEALEEKLLCPFHYFGVSDSVDISADRFWKNGKYDTNELTDIFVGDHFQAKQRLDVIIRSIKRYQPNLTKTKAIGFCASVRHARFMAEKFREAGYKSEELLGETSTEIRNQRIQDFREGKITFLFSVDVISEGIDIPEINLVLFLRPTESLTVFLQQLGRGLRNAPEKECLTVLDFVGLTHQKYRVDQKFSSLLNNQRRRIDQEIELDFPNLPAGCSIQLERIAREHILENIRQNLGNFKTFVCESIRTFQFETKRPLNFTNFINETRISPLELLKSKTWAEWKSIAGVSSVILDSDIDDVRKALRRICLRTDPVLLNNVLRLSQMADLKLDNCDFSEKENIALHYILWGKASEDCNVKSYKESLTKWFANVAAKSDLLEIVQWRKSVHTYPITKLIVDSETSLYLHATYGLFEINAAFGLSNIQNRGPTGVGVIHLEDRKIYIHLVTFHKEEKDFAPTTRYKDYLINRSKIHWESQASTTQTSKTGENYILFKDRGYKILFFARLYKRTENETMPFVFLGEAENLCSYEGNRPISMIWDLQYPVPAEMFEQARL